MFANQGILSVRYVTGGAGLVSERIAKYKKLILLDRSVGIVMVVMAGLLFVISEERSPSLYLAVFVGFHAATLATIGLTIYTSRYQRHHAIHHHR
jgi:hypothetical protein